MNVVTVRLRRIALLTLLLLGLSGAAIPSQAAFTLLPAWTHIGINGSLPPARAQYGMVIDASGSIYIFGGWGLSGVLGDFWRFTPATASWQHLSSTGLPTMVEPHLAVDAAGNVYEFGGLGAASALHMSSDGHSFGLYEYLPTRGIWIDLTVPTAQPNVNWPLGREDHGFAFDQGSGKLYVFGGEGPGLVSMNDLWNYDLAQHVWQRVAQHYAAPNGAILAGREIYNISDDAHGGLYLFGGAYVEPPDHHPVPWTYVNDLWRFDIVSATWHLLAGTANAYDPTMPLPRHYYGQSCGADGAFYILSGYVSATTSPPYFNNDNAILDAQVVAFGGDNTPTGDIAYALNDFWRFDREQQRWQDLSSRLGALSSDPFIPYMMVTNSFSNTLVTFGGYHTDQNGLLVVSSDMWFYSLPSPSVVGFPTITTTTSSPPARVTSPTPPAAGNNSTASPTPHR